MTDSPGMAAHLEAKASLADADDYLDAAILALGGTGPTPEPPPRYPLACHDREPRAKPPLPVLQGAGYTFTDPAFGATLVRVTDATLGGSSWRVPSNAHLTAWNADGSKFVIVGPSGTKVMAFDGGTVRPLADVYSQCEPCWSRCDPAVLYTIGGSTARIIQSVVFDGDEILDTRRVRPETLGLSLEEPRPRGRDRRATTLVVFSAAPADRPLLRETVVIGETAMLALFDTREYGYSPLDGGGSLLAGRSALSTNARRTDDLCRIWTGDVAPATVFPWPRRARLRGGSTPTAAPGSGDRASGSTVALALEDRVDLIAGIAPKKSICRNTRHGTMREPKRWSR